MKVIIHITFLMVFVLKANAQDFISSQYLYNRLAYNSSFAGYDGAGKFRFNTMNRNQYNAIKGPFYNTTFSTDFGLCNLIIPFGVGLVVSNDRQGDGLLSRTDIGLVLGYHIDPSSWKIGKETYYYDFGFGLESGFISQSVDWTKYTFSDQLDPINGAIFPSSNSNIGIDYKMQPNFNFGSQFNFWNFSEDFKLHTGIVISNIFQPSIGLLNTSTLDRRYSVSFGLLKKRISKQSNNSGTFIANFRFDRQNQANTSIANIEVFLTKEFSLGIGTRVSAYNQSGIKNTWTMMFLMGLLIKQDFKVMINPEFVFINSGVAFNTELALVYIPRLELCKSNRRVVRGRGNTVIKCPSF